MNSPFDTRHLLSHRAGTISEVASELASLPTERVKELLALGAFYANSKRVNEDVFVESGTYLRLHLKPKRYDTSKIDWAKTLRFENEHMVIIDKPRGFPVHPMVDNKIENVIFQVSRQIGRPLYVTQRLDVMTDGLFVVAKTKEFQKEFNFLLHQKQIRKIYRTFVEKELRLGTLKHYMKESERSPKEVAERGPPGEEAMWKECILNIVSSERVNGEIELAIELITGRTHQIRAQLSHEKAPIIGDKLYGSLRPESEYRLTSTFLSFTCPFTGEKFTFA